MRVRLYEMGSKSVGVVYIEQFPTELGLTEDGQLSSRNESGPRLCSLEEQGGQIILRAGSDDAEVEVNDAPLAEGPLLPGDRLRLRDHRYLVSYELTTNSGALPTRFRIQR